MTEDFLAGDQSASSNGSRPGAQSTWYEANQRYLATTYNRASGIAVCQPAYILGEPSAFRYYGFRRHHPSNSPDDSAWCDSPGNRTGA